MNMWGWGGVNMWGWGGEHVGVGGGVNMWGWGWGWGVLMHVFCVLCSLGQFSPRQYVVGEECALQAETKW